MEDWPVHAVEKLAYWQEAEESEDCSNGNPNDALDYADRPTCHKRPGKDHRRDGKSEEGEAVRKWVRRQGLLRPKRKSAGDDQQKRKGKPTCARHRPAKAKALSGREAGRL